MRGTTGPSAHQAVFRLIWSAIGAVGTVTEVSGTSEDDTWWDSWYRPSPRPPSSAGPRAAATARQAREAGQEAAKASICAGRWSSGGGRYRAPLVLPGGGPTQATGYLPTGSSAGQDAQQTARAFLRAWDAGHLRQAANYTNHPAAARAALTAFRTYLHLGRLTSTAGSAKAISSSSATPREKVIYAASARVATSDGAAGSAGPGATTHRWSPTRRSIPSTGTSPGHPPTWLLTSPRPRTLMPSRSPRASPRSPTPAATI